METKDLPHGIVGFNFANALVNGEFESAYALLSTELQLEYPVSALKREYEKMIDYMQPVSNVGVAVLNNGDLPDDSDMDSQGWAYVAIFGDCWSEAVTVTVKPFEGKYLITELSWGRP
jgi:hypothetical protein